MTREKSLIRDGLDGSADLRLSVKADRQHRPQLTTILY
jgi:hypothetical protein